MTSEVPSNKHKNHFRKHDYLLRIESPHTSLIESSLWHFTIPPCFVVYTNHNIVVYARAPPIRTAHARSKHASTYIRLPIIFGRTWQHAPHHTERRWQWRRRRLRRRHKHTHELTPDSRIHSHSSLADNRPPPQQQTHHAHKIYTKLPSHKCTGTEE